MPFAAIDGAPRATSQTRSHPDAVSVIAALPVNGAAIRAVMLGDRGRHRVDWHQFGRNFFRGLPNRGDHAAGADCPLLAFPQIALVLVRLRPLATMPLSICFD
jgi:hypothetical protein